MFGDQKKKLQIGRTYIATSGDGVEVKGMIHSIQGTKVHFGRHGHMFVMLGGWEFKEVADGEVHS